LAAGVAKVKALILTVATEVALFSASNICGVDMREIVIGR
jgi:hypothetical protein